MADAPTVRAEHVPGQVQGVYTAPPKGIILHGSRGGAKNVLAEYAGTVNWAANNPDGLGWTATIGPRVYCTHMDARHWAWNAREHSRDFLAVEFAQPALTSSIPDTMVDAFVAWYWAEVRPVWPLMTPRVLVMPMHSELPAGKRDGKTDAFKADSAQAKDLRARIYAALEVNGNPSQFVVGPGVQAALDRAHDVAMGHEVYVNDALSYTPGRDGLYWYAKASDAVYRAPKS